VLIEGAKELRHHLAFRDALRADNVLRDKYAALKRGLAEAHPRDRNGYTDAKTDFISAALESRVATATPAAQQ
jgi:GrpB-like predicted nucleotidyltransferase (UPF0157 family)